jgi:hypothetical protein
MKIFLIVSALFPVLFGVPLIVAPAAMFGTLGIDVTPAIAQMAGTQGAAMLGLGVINWFARSLTGRAVVPVLAGNLVVQLLSLVVVLRAMAGGAPLSTNLVSVAIHSAFGAGFAYFLLRERGRA